MHNAFVGYDLVIRGGTVVNSERMELADVGIVGGKIVEVGDISAMGAAQVINASGLHVMPGIIDTQVHFREPGMEHKEDLESGTRAAIMGGVTTIFEMPNTHPPTTSAEALMDKLQRAKGRAWCDFSFFVGASADNTQELAALEMLPGTPGVKIFMGSSTGSLLVPDDETLERVLINGISRCPVHAEDHDRLEERKGLASPEPHVSEHPYLRDEECARLATERILALSQKTRRPVHILHVSTAEELPLIRAAKARGLNTTAEVTPQHLFFKSPECYEELGTLAQMNPPIRDRRHQQALRRALQENLFDVLGSDHAPHTLEEKAKPYPSSPSGMPGVQTLAPVMFNFVNEGLLTLRDFVRLACEGPARIYGIKEKGRIEPGFDADLCIADMDRAQVVQNSWLQSKCGWSPYEGLSFIGWPVHVVLRGSVVVRDQALIGSAGGAPVRFAWKD